MAVPAPPTTARLAAGHQLLYAAAFAQLPLPIGVVQALPGRSNRAAPERVRSRWSADAWMLLRPDYRGPGVGAGPYPAYGASQAGAVLRYRLAPSAPQQPMIHLRINAAVDQPHERDLALGVSLRLLPRVPLRLAGELRATQGSGRTRLRPAAFVVTELAPITLPQAFRAEVYGQAGVVGGAGGTAFVDAQVRLDRRIAAIGGAELRGGGGMWGGAQDGAERVDIGPGVTVGMRLGSTNARLSADWRFRVAGQAAPASGPAITLSAGF